MQVSGRNFSKPSESAISDFSNLNHSQDVVRFATQERNYKNSRAFAIPQRRHNRSEWMTQSEINITPTREPGPVTIKKTEPAQKWEAVFVA
jgi:hypothetical protein